ncbi:hypothetical protein GCM10023200_31110 [Actinomycetospora chlora]|uniref:Uncharacterized protein n=1 Tax=Actinomycetospora chlora TaxID=663608 RepID=A0ABP9BEX6_9PSEU
MRALVIGGVTLILFVGAAPLAVPGVPLRLHGVPTPVALGVLGLAVVAFLAGLLLLARGRRARRRDEVPAPRPAPSPTPSPRSHARPRPAARAPTPGFVAVRLRR